MALDGTGTVCVAEDGNNNVLQIPAWDPTCALCGCATISSILGNGVTGVAVDGKGNLYIANRYGIARRPAGNLNCSQTGECTLIGAKAGLNYPQEVAVDGAGNVYIADTSNSRELMVPPTDPTCGQGACISLTPDQLAAPQSVAVDAAGAVYVTDVYNSQATSGSFRPRTPSASCSATRSWSGYTHSARPWTRRATSTSATSTSAPSASGMPRTGLSSPSRASRWAARARIATLVNIRNANLNFASISLGSNANFAIGDFRK